MQAPSGAPSTPCYRTTDSPPRYFAIEGNFVVEVQPLDPSQCSPIPYTADQLRSIQESRRLCELGGGQWQPLGPPYGGQCVGGVEPAVDSAWDWLKNNWWWVLLAVLLIGLIVAAMNSQKRGLSEEGLFALFPVAGTRSTKRSGSGGATRTRTTVVRRRSAPRRR